jgi:hypothetical protein
MFLGERGWSGEVSSRAGRLCDRIGRADRRATSRAELRLPSDLIEFLDPVRVIRTPDDFHFSHYFSLRPFCHFQ